jgi:hypothetical protein
LRTTALPSFLVTVKPKRAGPAVAPLRSSIKKAAPLQRGPPRTFRKSARLLIVTRPQEGPISGREFGTALGSAAGEHAAATDGGHALAEAMAAFADEFAGLICALHVTAP